MTKKKVKKKIKKANTKVEKKAKDPYKVEFYQILLKHTVKNIKNDGSELDKIFMEQADRITKEMKEFK